MGTNNTDTNTRQSVLATLRALVPARPLTPSETLRVAELQANRFLRHFEIDTPPIPEEVVGELPRISVVREEGLPVSGAVHWTGSHWVISVNADEPLVRQRFSVMHEFKHVVDHPSRDLIYRDRTTQSASEQAERVADYFAACVLMPKKIMKRLWYAGNQNVAGLAVTLGVSRHAVRIRLDQLGLTQKTARCDQPLKSRGRPTGTATGGLA